MPIEKNQSFTFLFPSRKLDGSANSTLTPTITISKDGAPGVALAAPALVAGMGLTWSITLTAAQMNCTSLAIEHTGGGLEAWGATLCPEAAYTSAKAVNLDAAVSSRGTSNYAGGAVASVTASVTLQAGEYTNISDRMERAGGLLALVNMGLGWLTSMQELVTGGIRRFKASALSQTPLGDGSTGENLAALNVTVGSLQTSMNRIAGLVGENQVSRDFVYDGAGTILSFTIRSYDTAANAETDDGASGLLGEYSATNTLSQDGLVEATTTTLNA